MPAATISMPIFQPLIHDHDYYGCLQKLLYQILSHLNMRDLMMLASTTKFNRSHVLDYIQLRKKKLALHFFKNEESFFESLSNTGVVVSGFAAVHLLLPTAETNCMPSNLVLYVSNAVYTKLEAWIARQGFCILHVRNRSGNAYLYSEVEQKLRFHNGHHTINIVISNDAACAPMFQLHSTAAMNFFNADRVFCAYPQFTLAYLSMVNPAPLYCNAFQSNDMTTLEEYEMRGFTYIAWSNDSNNDAITPYQSRSLTDRSCMFVTTAKLLSPKRTLQDGFYKFGVIDIEWCLGGRLHSSSRAFVYPRIRVVRTKKCVQRLNGLTRPKMI